MTAALESPAPADVLLADGSIAVVRPLRTDDGPALHELHEGVSDEAIRLRFFSVARHAAHTYVDHVLADRDTLALVAEHHGRLVGLATAEPMGGTAGRDRVPGRRRRPPAGRRHPPPRAPGRPGRSQGITEFEADVLAENHAMLTVFAHAGFALTRALGPGHGGPDPRHHLDAGEATDRADEREFQAEWRSLVPLLRPTSVAVVGIRSDETASAPRSCAPSPRAASPAP